MTRVLIGPAATVVLAFLSVLPHGQGQRFSKHGEQRLYAEDDQAFKAAQPLPREVVDVMLRSLMTEADVKQTLMITPEPGRPGSLFRAIPMTLGHGNDRWLLAVGTSPATSGADNGHFWL